MASGSGSVPFFLLLSQPLTGHIMPTLRVAVHLASSHPGLVFFLGPSSHAGRISVSGATFLPLRPAADLDDRAYYDPSSPDPPTPAYFSLPWKQRALVDLQKHCLDLLVSQWESVKDGLSELRSRDPARRVVIICEAFFHGILPMFYGAPLPPGVRRPRTVCLSVTPPLIRSVGLGPFAMFADPWDPSPAGAERNAAAWERWAAKTRPLKETLDRRLVEAGATHGVPLAGPLLSGANYLCHDAILQVGVPSFEFPRADMPDKLCFVGFLPAPAPPLDDGRGLPAWWPAASDLPEWWPALVAAGSEATRKRIVVVAQGTVEGDPESLILPTLRALAEPPHLDSVLVVAILCRKGVALPREQTPANALVVDQLPYYAVVPRASVWIHNGGYGAITQGVAYAVPMVVAGEGQDKTENCARIQHSGVGINLRTGRPSEAQIRAAVEQIFADEGGFRERLEKMRAESEGCFERIEREIERVLQRHDGAGAGDGE